MSGISVNVNRFLAEQFPKAILAALNDSCQIIENEAKRKCPVDDSQLRTSITHKVEQEKDNFVGQVGSNVEHAPFVHEGTGLYAKDGNGRKNVPWTYCDAKGNFHKTSGQKPQPFLQDAIDENLEEVLKPFQEVF